MIKMMAPASSKNEMQHQNDLVAKEHLDDDDEGGDPEMHPLAAEEWLGSHIFMALADPRATCQLALLNKNFYTASKSNLVWQKLLPPPSHLESLFQECDDNTLQNSTFPSRKDLYFHLCKSLSLGGGLKKFWLDQKTGGECYMLSARALSIAWGSSPQYWQWLACPGAWFPEVAFLQSVCWFDIAGRFRQLLKPGSYAVSFRMQMRSASIWRWSPIKLSLQNVTYAQPPVKSSVFFHGPFPVSTPPIVSPPTPDACQPSANDPQHSESDRHPDRHVWVECDVGEFTVDEDSPVEVEFSMREVEVLGWKRGFLLDGVLIRPTYVVAAQARSIVSMGSEDEQMRAIENMFYEEEDEENEENEDEEGGDNGGNDDDDGENVDDVNDDDDDGRCGCSRA